MRLKRNRLHTFHHQSAVPAKNNEGASYIAYGEKTPFLAEDWATGGNAKAEMYGTRLPNIRSLRLDGSYHETQNTDGKVSFIVTQGETIFPVTVNDGICICSEGDPDYKVVALYPYSHLTLEVEKL